LFRLKTSQRCAIGKSFAKKFYRSFLFEIVVTLTELNAADTTMRD